MQNQFKRYSQIEKVIAMLIKIKTQIRQMNDESGVVKTDTSKIQTIVR